MKHEIITNQNVQVIGMAKEIAFNNPAECAKFWGEYVERIVKPVFMEGKTPDEFQQAAIDNNVGEFGLCTCTIPNHNCGTCAVQNFTQCNTKTFTYVIGGTYRGGNVPKGMQLYPIRDGKWLKVHFEGGMKAFQEQFAKFHQEWLPAHPEYKWADNACCMEWYCGTDINSPDYQCGIMMPLETLVCQSCGMPLTKDEDCGKNADGSINYDYCQYCYKDGHFVQECTMEEMIEHCSQFVDEVNKHMPEPMTREDYKQMMRVYFPMMKRWRK